jgi:hypothetical protein
VVTGDDEWSITTYGIPSYQYRFTTSDISSLNARTNKASEFVTGATTAVVNTRYNLVKKYITFTFDFFSLFPKN